MPGSKSDPFSNDWHTRYARQISLKNWGEQGQKRLGETSVLIVGLGGLGSPVATYLAAAGVGQLLLNDFDTVDLSNLPRQPLHGGNDLGTSKTQSAYETLIDINPHVTYTLLDHRLSDTELLTTLQKVDCAVDCSDNFTTRFCVNAAAVATKTPLVSVAAIRQEGQLIVFRNDMPDSPCYRCLYHENNEPIEDCQGQGVMTPLVGVMGSMAATAVLNHLVFKQQKYGQLLCFDAQTLTMQNIKLGKDPRCPVCADLAR